MANKKAPRLERGAVEQKGVESFMSILTEIEDRCNVWHRKMLEMDPPTAVAREYFDLLETVVQMRDFSVDLKEAWAANEAHSI